MSNPSNYRAKRVGGLLLCEGMTEQEICEIVDEKLEASQPPPPHKGDSIPDAVTEGTNFVDISLDVSGGTFDATDIPKPAGLAPGGMLQLTKADKSKNPITFNSGTKTYKFTKCGDILCLRCDGEGGWCISG